MKKIKTIFDRDWNGNRTVIDKYLVEYIKNYVAKLSTANIAEK